MGAETKIIVRVLRAHEETIEVYAVTRLEAEAEAHRMEGVVAVLESGYPENMPNEELSGGEAVRSDDLLAQFGPKLTPEEVVECISLSGEPCCQACGREWKDHHQRCEGSAEHPDMRQRGQPFVGRFTGG
jgi:hypothetical protein